MSIPVDTLKERLDGRLDDLATAEYMENPTLEEVALKVGKLRVNYFSHAKPLEPVVNF